MNLMTRHEVSSLLGIGLRTLDRRLADKELECYHLGDGPKAPVRISEEQLNDYLEKHCGETEFETYRNAAGILDR